jgi:hypothetical protein
MKILHALGDEAAGPGGVTRGSFVAIVLRETSAGLCTGNFFMYRECLGLFAKPSGTVFRAGMSVPTGEHGLLQSACVRWFVCHVSSMMLCRGVRDDERSPDVDVFPWSC